MRQIILDTETTGLEPSEGHRIIEIGCVELVNRRITGNTFHQYIQPDREIDAGAREVHGITDEFLADKPRFADIADEFLVFIRGAELIIHNAPFDVGFINHEFSMLGNAVGPLSECCTIVDTLAMARKMHPGQKNSLDALCKRYSIDNSQRTLHGALLDAEILADVYLTMTGGQVALQLEKDRSLPGEKKQSNRLEIENLNLIVQQASEDEIKEHETVLENIRKTSGSCVWDELPN